LFTRRVNALNGCLPCEPTRVLTHAPFDRLVLETEHPLVRQVFETEHAYAMLDAFPVARFHCLLLPKTASMDVGDLDPTVAAAFLKELPRLVAAVKEASGAPAVKVMSNAGAAAGQVIFHTHFHVIPRFAQGDSLASSASMVDAVEAAESVRLLQVAMRPSRPKGGAY